MKKFELTREFITFLGRKLFRIKALVEFGDVKAGELGGYVEKEENINHEGNAWVYGNARVYGDARVYGNARVSGDARVYGNARVYGDAWVSGDAWVYGNAWVSGDAWVVKQEDIIFTAAKFGTIFRTTTAYRTTDGVQINCGCFSGNLEEFREQITQTREGRMREKYLHHADEIEMYFDLDLEKEEK